MLKVAKAEETMQGWRDMYFHLRNIGATQAKNAIAEEGTIPMVAASKALAVE